MTEESPYQMSVLPAPLCSAHQEIPARSGLQKSLVSLKHSILPFLFFVNEVKLQKERREPEDGVAVQEMPAC